MWRGGGGDKEEERPIVVNRTAHWGWLLKQIPAHLPRGQSVDRPVKRRCDLIPALPFLFRNINNILTHL